MNDFHPEVMKVIPGVFGSIVSMLFVEDTWPRRILMWLGGAALAYYFTPWLAPKVSIPEGMSGFLLGLTGMFVVARTVDAVKAIMLAPLIEQWIRILLRLPPKENS